MTTYTGIDKPKIDIRDYKFKTNNTNFPLEFELINLPPVLYQGTVGQCTAFAARSILEYFNICETGKYTALSNDFIYGLQRKEFNDNDRGLALREACKIVQKYGDVTLETCGGLTEMPECADKVESLLESSDVLDEAYYYSIDTYAQCMDNNSIKHALMENIPILACIPWGTKPTLDENHIIHFKEMNKGYHAVMIYGWNEYGWLCQNSWGNTWGHKGTFVLPHSEKITQAFVMVDADREEVVKPYNNKFLNILYKIINFIVNAIIERINNDNERKNNKISS